MRSYSDIRKIDETCPNEGDSDESTEFIYCDGNSVQDSHVPVDLEVLHVILSSEGDDAVEVGVSKIDKILE